MDFTFYVANIMFLSKKSVLTFLMDRQNPCPQPLMTTALILFESYASHYYSIFLDSNDQFTVCEFSLYLEETVQVAQYNCNGPSHFSLQ